MYILLFLIVMKSVYQVTYNKLETVGAKTNRNK